MLVVAAVVRMLLLMRLRTWLLSLLWGARFGPRLLRLLRVEFLTRGLLRLLRVIFLTRLGLRLRPGLLTRCLLDLLRVIFRPRLGLRLRAGLLTRCLLGLLRVIFLRRLGLRLRSGFSTWRLLRLLLAILRCTRLLLLLLRIDIPLSLLRRTRSHRRILRRMRNTMLLRLLCSERAWLLAILRLALLLRERLASAGLLGRTMLLCLLGLHRHRRVRLRPRRLAARFGRRLLACCKSGSTVLRERVRIASCCLRRTRHTVVRLWPFISKLGRRTRCPRPRLLSHAMGRLRRIRAASKRTRTVRSRLTGSRCTLRDTRLGARRHARRVRLYHPHVLRAHRGATMRLGSHEMRRHGSAHDRFARARHPAAALRETLRQRVVIGRRHGRTARRHHRAGRHRCGPPGLICGLRHCRGSTFWAKRPTGWPCTKAAAGTAVTPPGAR
jgi:hypothetical protein